MSFWNRLGSLAKDLGESAISAPKFAWDMTSALWRDEEEYNGFVNTIKTASKNFAKTNVETIGNVASLPVIKQGLEKLDEVNREVIREPLTALALMDSDFKKTWYDENGNKRSIGDAWRVSKERAETTSFGQALYGSLATDFGNEQNKNKWANFDWDNQEQVDKYFSEGPAKYASGFLDATIQVFGDVSIVGGKAAKAARGASWASNTLNDTNKLKSVILGVREAEDSVENVNKFSTFLDTLVKNDSVYIKNMPEMKEAPQSLIYALGNATDKKTAGIIYRAGLGDPNALSDLDTIRPDILNTIAREKGDMDAFQKWNVKSRMKENDQLEFPWESTDIDSELSREITALKENDQNFSLLFELKEMAQTGGGTLARSAGSETVQALNRFIAGGRTAKYYDLKETSIAKVDFFQPTPAHRMYQVFSWPAGERPAGIVNLNDPDSVRDITAAIDRATRLGRGSLDNATGRQLLDEYIGAVTPEARALQVLKIENQIFTSIAAKHGMDLEDANKIYGQYKRARQTAQESLKSKGYAVDVDGTVIKVPLFESQTANFLPMMDFDLADRVLRKYNLVTAANPILKGIGWTYSAAGDVVDGLDTLQSLFKIGVLTRIGFPIRNGIEAQLRIASTAGAMASMRHLPEGVKNLAYNISVNGGRRVVDRMKYVGKGVSVKDDALQLKTINKNLLETRNKIAELENKLNATSEESVDFLLHGTNRNFEKFSEDVKPRSGGVAVYRESGKRTLYFTKNKKTAEKFAESSGDAISIPEPGENQWYDWVDQWGNGNEEKAIENFHKKYDVYGWVSDTEQDILTLEQFKDYIKTGSSPMAYPKGQRPRVIEVPVYGKTIDLRIPKSKSNERYSSDSPEFKNFLNNLPQDLIQRLKSEGKFTSILGKGDWLYSHEGSDELIAWMRENNYGKALVDDNIQEGYSYIAVPEAIDNPSYAKEFLDPDTQAGLEALRNLEAEQMAFASKIKENLAKKQTRLDVGKRRMASGTFEYTGLDGTPYKLDEAFGGPFADIFWRNSSSENSMMNVVDNQAALLSSSLVRTTRGAVKPTDANYYGEWARVINTQFGNSVISQKILSGQTDKEILNWLQRTDEGKALSERLLINKDDSLEHIAQVRQLVDKYIPDAELAKKITQRVEVTAEELSSRFADTENLPVVHGHIIEENLSRLGVKKVASITNGMMKLIGSMPEDAWARHPLYAELYKRSLMNRVDSFTSVTGNALTKDDLARVYRQAHNDALRGTKSILYTVDRKTNLASFFRLASPFFSAFENSVKTWARLAYDKPQIVNRANLIFTAPNRAGIATDENGNPVPADKASMNDYIWIEVPEGMKNLPFIGKGLSSLDQMGIQKKSLDVVFQGGFNVPVGPYVAVPISQIVKSQPTLEQAFKWALPYGPERNAATAMLPAWVKRQITKNEGQDNVQYANTYTLIWQTEMYKAAQNGTEKPTAADIKKMTDAYWNMRTVANLVLPFAPTFQSPYKMYMDKWKQYKDAYGKDAEAKYWQDFGDDMFQFTMSLSKNYTGSGATVTDVENAKKYSDLIASVGDIDPKFIGLITATGRGAYEFSNAAYQWQQMNVISPNSSIKFRGSNDPAQAIKETNASLGWVKYRSIMDKIDSVMQSRGIKNINSKGAEDIASLKKAMVEQLAQENNDWYIDYKDTDGSKYIKTREVFSKILSNEKFMADNSENPTWKSIATYLNVREQVDAVLANRKSKSLASKENADIAALLEITANQLKQDDIAFGDIYDRYFSYDPGFDPALSGVNK